MAGIAHESVVERARSVLEPVLARDGYEVVDVEWLRQGSRWTLRLFIDKEGGVGIDDCQAVSRTVDPILDAEDFAAAGRKTPARTALIFACWLKHLLSGVSAIRPRFASLHSFKVARFSPKESSSKPPASPISSPAV